MTISGIVMSCRPEHLEEVADAVGRFPWAEVHYRDPIGRLVVTTEAADIAQGMDRLRQLRGVPRVLAAELAEYCIEPGEASDLAESNGRES